MKPIAALLACLPVLCADLVLAAEKPGRKYAIQLHRATKAGTKFRLIVKGSWTSHEERTVGTEVADKKTGFEMEFRGVLTVLKNTKDGGEKKMALTVEKFTLIEKGKTHEALAKGTRLVAALKGREEVFAEVLKDGKVKPLEAGGVVQALRMVVSLDIEGDANDDAMFGSKLKRAVGEKWPVNKQMAIANMKRDGIIVALDKFSGQTRFPKIVKVSKLECVYLEGGFKATGFRPPIPKEFEVQKSVFTAEYSGKFPLDKRLPELETTVDVTTSFTAFAPAKGDMAAIDWMATHRTRKHIWVELLD